MTVIFGYADRISVMPGDTIRFMISCIDADSYRADVVRLLSADAGPKAPPFRVETVETSVNGEHPGRRQDIHIGSFACVPAAPLFADLDSFTVQAMVWPTRPGAGRQGLLGTLSEDTGAGFGLGLDEDGALELRLGDGQGGVTAASTGVPLTARRWYFVAASFDAASGTTQLHQESLPGHTFDPPVSVAREQQLSVHPVPASGPLVIGAWHRESRTDGRVICGGHYDGKIDRPRLAGRVLDRTEMQRLTAGTVPAELAELVVGAWDFGRDIASIRISDVGPHGLHGEAVNLPARGMTGHNWDGTEMSWRHAPEQYGAIHFHADDLYDAGWDPDLELTLPDDLRSGVYALRLQAGESERYVVFFVRPPPDRTTAKVAFLASTAAYLAYANIAWSTADPTSELIGGALPVFDQTDLLRFDYPELTQSTYDSHRDGSGICYSSRLRPVLNLQPNSRLWNFVIDLFVIAWLERLGFDYDVVTDDDLHRDGARLLEPYRAVLTGCHPEYYSLEMMDGLEDWLGQGGRLMYLGGNGFYWRIAYHPELPGVLEVRRTETAIRTWAAETGEYYHSFSGEYGGLWRHQRRAPNRLVGIGFISQGFDASTYYRRTAAGRDARAAFIFEGIEDDILGDFGAALGGAVGLEVDCADRALGTPSHALVVARSEGLSNAFELVTEELLQTRGGTDAPHESKIAADMTFFETAAGGAVFSVGSIAYPASLSHNDFDNNIARLTTNVLRRFLDETPFEPPV